MKKYKLPLPDSDISYFPNFLESEYASAYFKSLKSDVPWRQDEIKVFGKIYPQPRLTALYGTNNKSYSYSGIVMKPLPFNESLKAISKKLSKLTPVEFTSCLINYYRDGKDSNGWHSDDEKELGKNPVIASVSLGQERYFHLRHRKRKELKHKILLDHGSLLLMSGPTQHFWHHQIPKTAKSIGERINLTFRVIP
ncbi:alpha-ketoglutarate-dependent dioxygenase AlkB [uncultured Eudoraea sp.]|uniref:alpha-ketoglutarate-dependent dioxygenase AlkB family protein n=1 Tax=uncultured Eudoraea sp. TaxID=1035614 RepID=UPI002623B7BA|nr:alpha-ketoglutarate-dependent dioxygenase AlkB [uncultured Eudoraea sp.]